MCEFFRTNRKPEIVTHRKRKKCWLCEKYFVNDQMNHCCKLTGGYLGAAHEKCIEFVQNNIKNTSAFPKF